MVLSNCKIVEEYLTSHNVGTYWANCTLHTHTHTPNDHNQHHSDLFIRHDWLIWDILVYCYYYYYDKCLQCTTLQIIESDCAVERRAEKEKCEMVQMGFKIENVENYNTNRYNSFI